MSKLLYGKPVAEALYGEISRDAHLLDGKKLSLVGFDEPAWQQYAGGIVRTADSVGIVAENVVLADGLRADALYDFLDKLSQDENVAGILLQQPLKGYADAVKHIAPSKDIDCMTQQSVFNLYNRLSGFRPATPSAVLAILDYYGISLSGKNVVVIGRGSAVGKPLMHMLLDRNATVTVCHTKTVNLADIAKRADVLISACGVPGLVKTDFVAADSIVVDVGLSFVDGKTTGDVDESVYDVCNAVTPVPGGVGPVTRACLLKNLIDTVK